MPALFPSILLFGHFFVPPSENILNIVNIERQAKDLQLLLFLA